MSLPRIALLLLCTSPLSAQGWTRLTNTALRASSTNTVCPPNNMTGLPAFAYRDNCTGVIDAWSGAVPDTVNNRLLIHGGGHAIYPGNEWYALDLVTKSASVATQCSGSPNGCSTNESAPTMTRLNDPSVWTDSAVGPNADGSPWATHSEGGLVFFPGANKVTNGWLGGTLTSGAPETKLELFNLSTFTWSGALTYTGDSPILGTESHLVLDPTWPNEAFLGVISHNASTRPSQLLRYDITTNTMTLVIPYATGANYQWPVNSSVAVDPDRKLFFLVGNDGRAAAGEMWVADLTSGVPTTATEITSTLNGCSDLLNATAPGFEWDPSIHKFVGYIPRRQFRSSSSVTIPTSLPASVTFRVADGLPFVVGGVVDVEDYDAVAAHRMFGTVTSYTSVGGGQADLTLNIPATYAWTGMTTGTKYGSGTYSNWILNIPYNEIIIFDPATRTCTIDPNSGVSGPGGMTGPIPDYSQLALDRGPYRRFAYFPGIGKYAVVLSYADDAYTFQLNATPTHGLGSSTFTCVDRDGDGYGTGPGCTGPDADDQDSGVYSGAQALSKWGTIAAYVRHLGYGPTNIWHIAPDGNDSTGAVNDSALPFATCCGTGKANPAAGDMLMFRGGDYNTYINIAGRGAQGSPIILLAYPGESPSFTTLGTSGISCTSYMVLDGFKLIRTEGNTNINCADVNHAQFKHVDSSGNKWGIVASNSTGVAMTDMTIEDSVFRDNWNLGCGTSEHGIYITSHQDQTARQANILDRDIFVRRNLLYQNCRNGVQVNGRFTNVLVEQNIAYSNDGNSGFAFLTGVQKSAMRSNLTFNNSSVGITLFDYSDFCPSYDPTGPCPYDQNYNVFEHNTIYLTGYDPKDGSQYSSQTAFSIVNSSATSVDLGHNTFRNNIAVTYSQAGAGSGYPQFRYDETAAPSTSTYQNNLFFSTQGTPGQYARVIQTKTGGVVTYYTCAEAEALSGTTFGSFTNCTHGDPVFVSASPSYWNFVALFSLRLRSASPAIGAAVPSGSPLFDLVGSPISFTAPSLGAYSFTGGASVTITGPAVYSGKGVIR